MRKSQKGESSSMGPVTDNTPLRRVRRSGSLFSASVPKK